MVEPPGFFGSSAILPGSPGLVSCGSKSTVFLMREPVVAFSSTVTVNDTLWALSLPTARFSSTHST